MPCSRNSLDVAKTNGQNNLVPIPGRVPVLNLEFAHGQSGAQPAVENLPKDSHGSGGFCGGFFVAKCKRKSPQPGPKSAAKPTNKFVCQASPVFSIEKDCSWRRLQSMDSGTLFGCLLGMVKAPMLKCTCNPSAAAGGMDKVCCAPFQTTLSVKSVCFEKTAQK